MAEQTEVVRDVVVVVGGAAGLSAALTLARARRWVTLVGAGEPRNVPADGVHGSLGLEGVSPVELLARGRDEVLGYGGRLGGPRPQDRRTGHRPDGGAQGHKATLFHQWSPDVVFFALDHQLEPQDRATMDALDVAVVAGKISRLEIDGDHVTGVRLDDGTVVATDQFGATSVPGVWAAGNSSNVGAAAADGARAAQHINTDLVMKDLDRAAAAAVDAPTDEGDPQVEHTFDNEYWDQIWQGDRAQAMGTGQPNPHLVGEVSDLTPGTALEAGCGAGAEAIWLATRGWQVTGADIAAAALDRAAERAAACGVVGRVQWVQADLSVWDPDTRYNLVTTHYAHPTMPQLEFYDRIASWVTPGGTLLVVGHLHPDATGGEGRGHSLEHAHERVADGPPASASATAATITARLDPAVWEVVTAQESHRTLSGHDEHETAIHDVVVRATRRN